MEARRIAGLLGVATLVFAQDPALACGDKLSMMGGGVSFDLVNPGRHRGNVILFAPPESPLRLGKNGATLEKTLERAGHKVRRVDTTTALAAALQAGNVDIVLTDAGDAVATPQRVAAASGSQAEPAPLALSYRPTAADLSSASLGRTCVAQFDSRGKQLLDAIENVLAAKGQVAAASCAPASVTSST
jgi:hypothetical protein